MLILHSYIYLSSGVYYNPKIITEKSKNALICQQNENMLKNHKSHFLDISEYQNSENTFVFFMFPSLENFVNLQDSPIRAIVDNEAF